MANSPELLSICKYVFDLIKDNHGVSDLWLRLHRAIKAAESGEVVTK